MMKTYELKPLDGRKSFYGKARVRLMEDGSKVLYSYGTPVCKVSPSGNVSRMWGGYSLTTMRHINSFLVESGADGGGKAWWDRLDVVSA